jgi:hypothetical protein
MRNTRAGVLQQEYEQGVPIILCHEIFLIRGGTIKATFLCVFTRFLWQLDSVYKSNFRLKPVYFNKNTHS